MAERCPKCGKPSASPPAEVYCVECATEGYEQDAQAWREHRAADATMRGAVDLHGEVADAARLRAERDEAVAARDHASSDTYERGFKAGQESARQQPRGGVSGRRWTLIGVRNPSDSGTHVCVTVDEPPLKAGERVEVVEALRTSERGWTINVCRNCGGAPYHDETCAFPGDYVMSGEGDRVEVVEVHPSPNRGAVDPSLRDLRG
jgi:hypothetical protein